jgi:4-amino-4-deoxy-L-arabinose transferase-like glycosyltransferase
MSYGAVGSKARHLGDAAYRAVAGVRTGRWVIAVLLFVLAFGLRLAPLNRYVTPDEPAWVLRSFRFDQALAAGDPSSVPDTGHPGITTMWLGSFGLRIQRWIDPQEASEHGEWLDGLAGLSPTSPLAFRHLAFFLPAGRVLVALLSSLGVVGIFFIADRLWGLSVAVLAAFLLALDAFLAGHSGLLHLDGLLATTISLSILAILVAVHSFERSNPSKSEPRASSVSGAMTAVRPAPYRWIALSGVMAGLAALTKIPGGFLAPFCGLLLIAACLTRRISLRQGLIALMLWGLAAGLVFFVLYPALWVHPLDTLRGMFEVGERHVEGAIRPIFYRGQITYDPDATFYPVVWLFRATPLVMLGVVIAFVTYLRRPSSRRFDLFALLTFALSFGVFITFVGKKHDRYLLPAFLPLTLVAALGWERAGRLVNRHRLLGGTGSHAAISNPLIALLVLIQALLILPYRTEPLGYYNPVLGGPRTAQKWLDVGWGEGPGAAARWLNQNTPAEDTIVATPSVPTFASLFHGQTVPLDDPAWYRADFIVLPPQQGSDALPIGVDAFSTVYEKQIGGIRHASVAPNPALNEQVAYLEGHTRPGEMIVLADESALAHVYDGPADLVVLDPFRDASEVSAQLGTLLTGHRIIWYVEALDTSPITARQLQDQLACYGQPVSVASVAGITVSQIDLGEAHSCPGSSEEARDGVLGSPNSAARFGEPLGLGAALLPSEPIAWPDDLTVLVRWETLAPIPADYRAVLHLKDGEGRIWVEGGREMLDADYRRPSAWSAGDWTDQAFRLDLPPAIPPGRYSVELGVFDPLSGGALSAWDAAGDFAGLSLDLGEVVVTPPPNPPSPWDMVVPERFNPPLDAGSLRLLGYEPPPDRVPSGDRVWFDLYWRAADPPDIKYSLRWRLNAADGSAALETVVPLSPYPTDRWRIHELEQVRYNLVAAPDLPAGDYSLSINVLGVDGAPVWPKDVSLGPVEVVARDRLFELPTDIAYPLDVTLGDAVHLRGFDLKALSASPGGTVPLVLYWQADGPTDLSYTVFVHLVGADGMLYGQSDRPPAGGAAPTHTWAPGQVVIDELSLPVLDDAVPGTYSIAVGLYDPVSGNRLPVYDAAGAELPNDQLLLPLEVTVE